MTSATEQLTKVEDQILETLTNLQKPVVDAVKNMAEKAEGRVPDVPRNENLPALDDLLMSQFNFAEKLIANQREFAGALIEALKPVAPKPAAEAKARPKAAAKS